MSLWIVSLLVVVAVGALAAAGLLRGHASAKRAVPARPRTSVAPRTDHAAPPTAPDPAPDQAPVPDALRAFRWIAADALPPARQEALAARLRGIPRPPNAVHRLLSHEFLAGATAQDLSDLIKGEPLIAAKLLAAVNSAQFSLQKPVASIAQAVTFLGVNAVRGLCLLYMLDASFKSKDPEQQAMFDEIWRTCAVASRICARLAQQLALPDQGALVTQVVLYFLGQVAIYSFVPKQVALAVRSQDMLARLCAEQELLGLNASELGALLMRDWGVPPSIIADVRDIDHVFDQPARAFEPDRGARLALCFASARMAEDAVGGRRPPVDSLLHDDRLEYVHFREHLQHGPLARLPELLETLDFAGPRQQSAVRG